MRKKAKITLIALFSALGFAFSASACAITMPEWFPDFGEKTEVTISGFDVKENLEMGAYTRKDKAGIGTTVRNRFERTTA